MEEDAQTAMEAAEAVTTRTAPEYGFDSEPHLLAHVNAAELESEVSGIFLRSAKWCADGSAILATAEDRVLRVYETPSDEPSFTSATPIKCPDAILSALWYPSATTKSPETYCFVAGIRDSPVRLVDASDGRTRATYPIVDHRERMIAPHAMTFNLDASKLYCGFDGAIEVFDVSNPGHDTSDRLKLAYAKRQDGGQKGIVSALAFVPDYSGTYAAGNLNGTAALYTEDTGATPVAHIEGMLGGGATQIAFNPIQPTIMFVASRRSSNIQVYDTRDLSAPVQHLGRNAETNQRLDFGVDPWGRYLAAGDQDGVVKIWDLAESPAATPLLERRLHDDAVGSVQLHPFQPWLLSVSGSRSYLSLPVDGDSDCSSDDSSGESAVTGQDETSPRQSGRSLSAADNSMGLWSFTPAPQDL